MLLKEGQRALVGQLGGGFVVRATHIAVEAVVGRVDLHLHLGLGQLEGFY